MREKGRKEEEVEKLKKKEREKNEESDKRRKWKGGVQAEQFKIHGRYSVSM